MFNNSKIPTSAYAASQMFEKEFKKNEEKNSYTNQNLKTIIFQQKKVIEQKDWEIILLEKQHEDLEKQLIQMRDSEASANKQAKNSTVISLVSLGVSIFAIIVSIVIGLYL